MAAYLVQRSSMPHRPTKITKVRLTTPNWQHAQAQLAACVQYKDKPNWQHAQARLAACIWQTSLSCLAPWVGLFTNKAQLATPNWQHAQAQLVARVHYEQTSKSTSHFLYTHF